MPTPLRSSTTNIYSYLYTQIERIETYERLVIVVDLLFIIDLCVIIYVSPYMAALRIYVR